MADTINDEIYQALYATYGADITTMLYQWRAANSLLGWADYADYVRSQTGVSNFNDAEYAFWSNYVGVASFMLLEDGSFVLLESNDKIIL